MASVTLVLVMGMAVLAKAEQLKEGGVLVLTDDNFDQVGCCLKGKLGEKFLSAQSFYLTLTKRSFNRQF